MMYTTVVDSPLVTLPLSVFVLTLMLHMLAVRFFPAWNLLDFPDRYGLRRRRLPYPAGILAVLVFLLIFPLIQAMNLRSSGVIAAVILLGITTFIDDRNRISPFIRLAIQILCALIIVLSGDCTGGRICSVTSPLSALTGTDVIDLHTALPSLAVTVSVIWLLLTTNALNWFDGIPGQTTLLSMIGFLTIGCLSLSERVNQPALALLAFMLAGISFAALLFDFPPPRVVLGDSGSMFFGLMLGVLTIYAGGKVATAFLVLGVPILDLLFVVFKRLREGRSPFRGSMSGEHLHHRLLEKGWQPRSVILLTAGIGTLFGATALFLDTFQKFIAGGILFCLMIMLWIYSSPKAKKLRS